MLKIGEIMLVNAQIVLMRCKTNKKLSGIRIEQTENGSWKINWAFPIKELSENNLNIYTCSTYFPTVPKCEIDKINKKAISNG